MTSIPSISSPDHLYGWSKTSLELIPLLPQDECNNDSLFVPKFSIVIPTLNQGDTIEDTICSIIYQNYPRYEIIVMDGGSTDQTLEIIDRYKPYLCHVTSAPDNGQSHAINRGFEYATGDIYAWINSDDYYLPGAFSKVADTFSQLNAQFLVGAGDVISKDQKFLRFIPQRVLNHSSLIDWKNDRWILQQSCFWRSSLWRSIGGVDESLSLLMDYDLWFKFVSICDSVAIDNKLAVMRYYPEAKTVKFRTKTNQELAYVYAKHGFYEELRELISSLTEKNLELESQLSSINNSKSVRIMKRLHLFPVNH